MRVRKILLLALVLALVGAACGDDDGGSGLTQKDGVLTVGSDIPYPPFEDFAEDGSVVGFDADIINEIADRLGLTVEWVDTDFDTIWTQLAVGTFDVVIAASTILPDRAAQVDFSAGYFNTNQGLVVNSALTPEIQGVADLQPGDLVAVQTGTTGATWAEEHLPEGVETVEFVQAPDGYNALEGGTQGVVALIYDIDNAIEEAANREGLAVVEELITGEVYGIGVDPARNDLLDEINRVFQEMLDDGTYQQIYDSWFDRPEGSVLYEEM